MRQLQRTKEYQGGYAMGHVDVPFPKLVEVLGEPYRNDPVGRNPNYPDDDVKTDVCWELEDEAGHVLNVWNYKNGPAYNDDTGKGAIEQINYFSYFCECPKLVAEFQAAISNNGR